MSAWTTAYCGICGLPMVGGMGSILRCPNDSNSAHNQRFGRPAFMPPDPRDAEIAALRAALDQERADNAQLRQFANATWREFRAAARMCGLLDLAGNPTALLSGRGDGGNDA